MDFAGRNPRHYNMSCVHACVHMCVYVRMCVYVCMCICACAHVHCVCDLWTSVPSSHQTGPRVHTQSLLLGRNNCTHWTISSLWTKIHWCGIQSSSVSQRKYFCIMSSNKAVRFIVLNLLNSLPSYLLSSPSRCMMASTPPLTCIPDPSFVGVVEGFWCLWGGFLFSWDKVSLWSPG